LHDGPPVLHGPYYQVDDQGPREDQDLEAYRGAGSTREDWIANHRKLKDVVRKMEALSRKETDRLLKKKAP
jgi:hypothetical protein